MMERSFTGLLEYNFLYFPSFTSRTTLYLIACSSVSLWIFIFNFEILIAWFDTSSSWQRTQMLSVVVSFSCEFLPKTILSFTCRRSVRYVNVCADIPNEISTYTFTVVSTVRDVSVDYIRLAQLKSYFLRSRLPSPLNAIASWLRRRKVSELGLLHRQTTVNRCNSVPSRALNLLFIDSLPPWRARLLH